MTIGYTTGAFDLFHVGHLNILKKARQMCDVLIVGVTTDNFIYKYKQKKPIIPFEQRVEILKSIKYVDKVVPQENHNKFAQWETHKFNIMFVGDDWKGTEKWNKIEKELGEVGVKVVYFERTKGISSSDIRESIEISK